MSDRIRQFIADNPQLPTPFLAIDTAVVRHNYTEFRSTLPSAIVHYAIKANPNRAVLETLAALGSSFDCASVQEIRMVLACGVGPERISFGNTIKKTRDIEEAFKLGVRLFATDSESDVAKIAKVAPGSEIFCRILTSGEGAEWPLSRKFGCEPDLALGVLCMADNLGLKPRGVSFHVGSQMTDVTAWKPAIREVKKIFATLESRGIKLDLVNIGGGFPTRYTKDVPTRETYGQAIMQAMGEVFGNQLPCILIEPGRAMVGDAGIIKTEVVLVAHKNFAHSDTRWAFLDIGKFGGLAETMDEAIRYRITAERANNLRDLPTILAGPTCDSADVLYEKTPYLLPDNLEDGDFLLIEGAGAYTTTYASVAFNGFVPLAEYVV